jgi:hypothetical protein
MAVSKRRVREVLSNAGKNGKEFSAESLRDADELKDDGGNYVSLSFKLYAIAWSIAMTSCVLSPLFTLGVVKLPDFIASFIFESRGIFILAELLLLVLSFMFVTTGVSPVTAGFQCQFIKDGIFFGCITKFSPFIEFFRSSTIRISYVCNRLDDVKITKYFVTLHGDISLEKRMTLFNSKFRVDNKNVIYSHTNSLRIPLTFKNPERIKSLVCPSIYNVFEVKQ